MMKLNHVHNNQKMFTIKMYTTKQPTAKAVDQNLSKLVFVNSKQIEDTSQWSSKVCWTLLAKGTVLYYFWGYFIFQAEQWDSLSNYFKQRFATECHLKLKYLTKAKFCIKLIALQHSPEVPEYLNSKQEIKFLF